MRATSRIGIYSALATALIIGAGRQVAANHCPFCAAVSLTFSEEIANNQVAVFAKLVQAPPKADPAAGSLDVAKAKFEITKVLKGEDVLGKTKTIETVYFGDSPVGSTFLIMGIDPPNINWATPIVVSERGQEYIAKTLTLPKEGGDRLAFFQDYLEDKDEMLARDAYDEFAKTPYSGVLELKSRMKHDQLVEWIKSPQIPVSRRRLYLTMLGVCGQPGDLPILEEMMASKDRQTKGALDALVAAYLTLKGAEGMPLVEELFLKNKDAEYTDTYATIMALRFHGTEEKIIPKDRLLAGIRLMLDRPQLADLVIPDLARWEDWSVMDRLVDLFKNADEESNWVRVPVINYLRACPLPAAKGKIEELAKIDPETVKRATTLFFPLGAAAGTPATAEKTPAAEKTPVAEKPAEKPADEKPATAEKPAAPAKPAAVEKPAAAVQPPVGAKSVEAGKPAEQPARSFVNKGDRGASASLVAPLSKGGPAAPEAPASNLPVFGGLAAAAVLLAVAFWTILTGGQRAVS